ncbi:MAG: Druantia anti-phage system protein DruA, partial [Candidatus Brocadiia bacterium]
NRSGLWNELIERYHYLGYNPLPGAQMRYLVHSGAEHGQRLLAALGFGAAAWKVAPRDEYIGWTHSQRKANLPLITNNARFLILPWVRSHNLASRILSTVSKRLSSDWQERYGQKPVLLETFVEKQRFEGTCYKAANWVEVGETKGRGKLDSEHKNAVPIKKIFLYPLTQDFRQALCSA